ncbi:MAG: zf-TFIIB domain-containing protein [Actinomycetota bacterium]|nr:zf-TFIIB domain-containing protein [Actinomycetota bacterium]
MQCPVCDVTLSISSREGVEIDFCPQCRGVWLDRGELDKIIDRAGAVLEAAQVSPPPVPAPRYDDRRPPEPRYDDRFRDDRRPPEPRYDDRYRDDRHRDDRYDDRYRGKKRKKKSKFDFLEDLFDL